VFAVTSLFLFITKLFFMQTQNGQNACQAIILMRISDDARYALRVEELLTHKHLLFLDNVRSHGTDALIESLRSAHDSIAYTSNQEIDQQFKDVLFDLKILVDWLEEI
jgi:hypothetical protein